MPSDTGKPAKKRKPSFCGITGPLKKPAALLSVQPGERGGFCLIAGFFENNFDLTRN